MTQPEIAYTLGIRAGQAKTKMPKEYAIATTRRERK